MSFSERPRAQWVAAAAIAAATFAMASAEIASAEGAAAPSELVERGHAAEKKAAALRARGDEARAKVADGVAQSWFKAARDATLATKREDDARISQLAAVDAGVQASRERALLEEVVAQNGRTSAQIAALKNAPKDGGAQ